MASKTVTQGARVDERPATPAMSPALRPAAILMSAGPFATCGTFTPEDDDEPPTIMIGCFATDAACRREATRNGLDPAEVIAFRDDTQHSGASHG